MYYIKLLTLDTVNDLVYAICMYIIICIIVTYLIDLLYVRMIGAIDPASPQCVSGGHSFIILIL